MTEQEKDDVRLLMMIAVLAGRREVAGSRSSIYEAWHHAFPNDALGPMLIGLQRYVDGDLKGGLELIVKAAQAETRADQARDVLADLVPDHPLSATREPAAEVPTTAA